MIEITQLQHENILVSHEADESKEEDESAILWRAWSRHGWSDQRVVPATY